MRPSAVQLRAGRQLLCVVEQGPLLRQLRRRESCSCAGIGCNTLEVTCDGPEDCMLGQVCCAETQLVPAGYGSVSCRPTAQCVSGVVTTRRELCHPNGLLCPAPATCKPDSGLPPGYATCQ